MEDEKVKIDIEEYISLRQESEELKNILKLIFDNSKYTKTIDEDRLYLNSSTSLMNYLKVAENYKYNIRLAELKEEKEENENVYTDNYED